MSEEKVIYFPNVGQRNTDKVLEMTKRYAVANNIRTIAVASTRGQTGVEACEVFPPSEYNLIIVTHHAGFRAPGEIELLTENRDQIEAQGANILIASHAFSGIERAVRKDLTTWLPLELFAKILRLFGEGTKVCVEITVMAADAQLIPMDGSDIIAIAGTGRGADTAWVISPVHSNNFFDMKLKKLLCKPEIW